MIKAISGGEAGMVGASAILSTGPSALSRKLRPCLFLGLGARAGGLSAISCLCRGCVKRLSCLGSPTMPRHCVPICPGCCHLFIPLTCCCSPVTCCSGVS